jgi:hypothetical protein
LPEISFKKKYFIEKEKMAFQQPLSLKPNDKVAIIFPSSG